MEYPAPDVQLYFDLSLIYIPHRPESASFDGSTLVCTELFFGAFSVTVGDCWRLYVVVWIRYEMGAL